jgi:multiple sugar transport system permease protein
MSNTRRSLSAFRLGLVLWDGLGTALTNLLVLLLIIVYLFPMTYMVFTALKPNDQFSDTRAPIWPAEIETATYEGKEYPMYHVPTEEGTRRMALVTRHREQSEFYDPTRPNAGLILWEGRWRTLDPVYRFNPVFENLTSLWNDVNYPRLAWNTLVVTTLSGVGAILSSVSVAYGFSRFRFPGSGLLFILLMATIIIPDKITLLPTYFVFTRILHWRGTWLPLIVPHLFGNAILIFLLRQNFKSIPREMEEAAMLDGAGTIRTLISIMLPQCVPVLSTVTLLHFFYAWNEIRMASLYLGTRPELRTLAFGIQQYQRYAPTSNRVQASALMAMVIPAFVLCMAQRLFMQDVVVTGLEK